MLSRTRAEEIESVAASLAREHGTADPELLAERMGIMLDYAHHPRLMGFCGRAYDVPYIALNSRLDDDTLRCVCAHELGHLALAHPLDADLHTVRSSELCNMEAAMESEANCFAAALLIPDADALEAIREYGSLQAIASALCVCVELLVAKLKLLRTKGFAVSVPDMRAMGAWKGEE